MKNLNFSDRKTRKALETNLLPKWLKKPTRKIGDHIAWSTMQVMVDGLTDQDTRLDLAQIRNKIALKDVAGLFEMAGSLRYTEYDDPAMLLRDRLVVESFSKYTFGNSPFDKKEAARVRFWRAEEMCKQANSRFRRLYNRSGAPNFTLSSDVLEIFEVVDNATRSIRTCLGSFDTAEMLDHSRFGPGATLCVTGRFTTEYFKLATCEPTVSSTAFPYAEALLNHDRKWLAYLSGMHPLDVVGRFNLVSDEVAPQLRIRDQNKVTFVPKNAKTERSIAIEPYFNLYFQLGIGKMIRKRLKKTLGVDLDSQQRNQDLAYVSSINRRNATVDFSMASDTLAKEVVRYMLPEEWFTHLNRLRSYNFLLDGVEHTYHKFSSMGNGFTFELETLIFQTLAVATCEHLGLDSSDVSTYGDDVVIPCAALPLFEKVAAFLGFQVNDEKSFSFGTFRESCGKDFLKGVPVRPVYCKTMDTVKDVVSYSNRLFALNRAVAFGPDFHLWLGRVILHLRGFIPKDVRTHLVGPPSDVNDTYVFSDCEGELSQSALIHWNKSTQSWAHPVIRFKASAFRRTGPAMVLSMLGSAHTRSRFVLDLVDTRRSDITGRDTGDYGLGYMPCDGLHGPISVIATN